MSRALNEKPNAEPLPTLASAGVTLNGRYLPPPEDKDGKMWVRTSALIHASAEDLYNMWRMSKRHLCGKSRSKRSLERVRPPLTG